MIRDRSVLVSFRSCPRHTDTF